MALQEELESQGNFLFRHRGGIPVLFILVGLATHALDILLGWEYDLLISEDARLIFCIAVSFIGLWIRIVTVGHTPRNTSGRNTADQVADEVNTTGIYSMVRHPLYVGNLFMWMGPLLMVQNIWFNIAIIFMYWVYYERIMFAEEQFLRRKFGDTYLNWASKVPAFVPKFGQRTPNKYPFSIKKVLKQEKNGFTAIFIVIYLFDVLGTYVRHGKFDLNSWLLKVTVASFIIYLILKYLKKFTNIFEEEKR